MLGAVTIQESNFFVMFCVWLYIVRPCLESRVTEKLMPADKTHSTGLLLSDKYTLVK